jgi:hypothetical protein
MDGSAPRVARAAARAFVCSGARRRRRSDRSYVPAGIPRRGPGAARGTHVSLACPERARAWASQIAVDTRPGFYPDERVLWLAERGALVFGDSLPGGAGTGRLASRRTNARRLPLVALAAARAARRARPADARRPRRTRPARASACPVARAGRAFVRGQGHNRSWPSSNGASADRRRGASMSGLSSARRRSAAS